MLSLVLRTFIPFGIVAVSLVQMIMSEERDISWAFSGIVVHIWSAVLMLDNKGVEDEYCNRRNLSR